MSVMNNVVGPIYDHTFFRYDKLAKQFVGKISATPAVLRQLWCDSLDLGFGIKGNRGVVLFTLNAAHKDADDKFTHWVFEAHNPTKNPIIADLRVVILND